MYNKAPHLPVMLKEVLENLLVEDNKTFVDCTFGAGGYTRAILEKAKCKVIALDQDPTTKRYADIIAESHPEHLEYINDNFRNLRNILANFGPVDGVVYDLGVSSMQLDEKERGFSFQTNSKLDMRMSLKGKSAYEIINETDEKELADIIYYYGDEPSSRRIAAKIVEARMEEPITTTFQLANIIRSVVRNRGKIDSSTKTFQAIRIAVNDELSALEESLAQLNDVLKVGGRVVVVSFHSLEDRIVKKFFLENSDPKVAKSKYSKEEIGQGMPFKLISRKSIKPIRDEIVANPRSRSARLRVVEKIRG